MIKELVWDSKFFERKIGRLTKVPSDGVLQKLIRKAWKENYQYLTCRFILDSVSDIQLLEKYGFYMTDLGVVWERKTGAISNASIPVREAGIADAPMLREISKGLFKDGRFYNDPFFTYAEAEKLYQEWIKSSLRDEKVKTFLVERKGFITCKRLSKDKGSIPLVGVAKGEQGKGTGSALICKALDWFHENGSKTVTVRTQANNLKAMNFYKGLGFSVKYIDLTMGLILNV